MLVTDQGYVVLLSCSLWQIFCFCCFPYWSATATHELLCCWWTQNINVWSLIPALLYPCCWSSFSSANSASQHQRTLNLQIWSWNEWNDSLNLYLEWGDGGCWVACGCVWCEGGQESTVIARAANDPSVFTITEKALLGPSPGWKCLPVLFHFRHYYDTMLNGH